MPKGDPLDPVALYRAKAQVKANLFGASREDIDAEPRVGRYTLVQMLGRGGFGAVFRAHDPKLSRDVAVKLVPLEDGELEREETDLQEARAMARLRHPSLVSVYDVGTCDAAALLGESARRCLYIVMERLEGQSLRQWLTARTRSPQQIVAVHIEAGKGVAAAHSAGVVHRDLKPSNIYVEGSRVCVLDFGLATIVDGEAAERSGEPDSDDTSGTPRYMAPEQRAGRNVGPPADQYALAACLFESLYGRLPARDSADANTEDTGPPRVPPLRGLSRPVRRALERALQPEPDRRFGSMREFIDALSGSRRRRRRGAVLVIAAAATAGLGSVGLASIDPRPSPADVCARFDDQATTLWNDEVRERVRDAFARLGDEHAHAFGTISHTLDEQLEDWGRARVAACRAAEVAGEPSALEYCLDGYHQRAAAVIALLEQADATVATHVDHLRELLEERERCEQEAVLPPLPGWFIENARAGLEVEGLIVRAKAHSVADKPLVSQQLAQQALEQARALDAPGLEAEAASVLCGAHGAPQGRARTREVCEQALVACERGDRPDLAVETRLHFATTLMFNEPGTAGHHLEVAKATRARLGADPGLDARIELLQANLDSTRGDHARAVAGLRKVREFYESEPERYALDITVVTNDLALAFEEMGELDQARVEFERAIAELRAASASPRSRLAALLNNLGSLCRELDDLDCARDALEQALTIKEQSAGSRSPVLLTTLTNLGFTYHELGDSAAALASVRRGIEIARSQPGEERRAEELRALEIDFGRTPGDPEPCAQLDAVLTQRIPGHRVDDPAVTEFWALKNRMVVGDLAGTCWLEAERPGAAHASYQMVLEGADPRSLAPVERARLLEKLALSAYQSEQEDTALEWLERLAADTEIPEDRRRRARVGQVILERRRGQSDPLLLEQVRGELPPDAFEERVAEVQRWLER